MQKHKSKKRNTVPEFDLSILKKLRIDKKITIKKMTEDLEISMPTLIDIEKNKSNPTLKTLLLISNYLGFKLSELFFMIELEKTTSRLFEELTMIEFIKKYS